MKMLLVYNWRYTFIDLLLNDLLLTDLLLTDLCGIMIHLKYITVYFTKI